MAPQEAGGLDDEIRRAQLMAGRKRLEGDVLSASNPGAVAADALSGNWTDSYGNTVCVYSADAFDAQLIATLSRPPRRDINLPVLPAKLGCGWHCGDAALVGSSTRQLWWLFPDGNVSIWTRSQGRQ
mmetsp:Transcript_40047/g.127434  ORF Transcript_40047/g.127434 Transcript_40047/m.127434 type:complete len:127 (-) Transcript_40047:341-721(-)